VASSSFNFGTSAAEPRFTDGGVAPLAPSAIPVQDLVYTKDGWVKASPNRALEIAEIKEIVEQFRQGAIRAKAAGFDGVEIHGANGYLIDQFLQDGSNKRTDIYGGSIENRTRFLLEVAEAVTSVWGGDRVGVRLGPSGTFGSMSDSSPGDLFGYAAAQLNRFGLAYLHLIEPRIIGSSCEPTDCRQSPLINCAAYSRDRLSLPAAFERDSAEEAIVDSGRRRPCRFGRHFAANPDLAERLRRTCRSTRTIATRSTAATSGVTSTIPATLMPASQPNVANEARDDCRASLLTVHRSADTHNTERQPVAPRAGWV